MLVRGAAVTLILDKHSVVDPGLWLHHIYIEAAAPDATQAARVFAVCVGESYQHACWSGQLPNMFTYICCGRHLGVGAVPGR